MNIREKYANLLNQELNLEIIDDVIALKNECKMTNNFEYFYLSNLLIIDIYINEELLDDALAIALKNFDDLDTIVYQKIYISLLERLIFICIEKHNYQSAIRYAHKKRLQIDVNDKEQVNRWYLEMSYIHNALDEKNRSLTDLFAILENEPDDNLKCLVLCNITKLYIDESNLDKAKEYLEQSMEIAKVNSDQEALTYCDYLNAKLLVLEKNYKFAVKIYNDIFKDKKELNNEFIGYLNEYITLLIDIEQYDNAKKISKHYMTSIEKTNDLQIKKSFYKNLLKANVCSLGSKGDSRKLFDYVERAEKEIDRTNELITTAANEDEKNLEVTNKLKETISKIEGTINLVNLALVNSSERDAILEFSKNLEQIIPFNEAMYVIFNRANFDVLPDFYDEYYQVSTLNYKKDRLYEREFSYNELDNTIIELLVTANKEVTIDFTDTEIPIKELITKKSYLDLKVKYLFAMPLFYDEKLYGCVIFTSNNYDLTSAEDIVTLKIASRLLEAKMVNLFYQESLRSQKNILQTAMNGLQEGLFYYDINNNKLFLSEQISHFLKIDNKLITFDDYEKLVDSDDVKIFNHRQQKIELGDNYSIDYTIKIDSKNVLVHEQGYPYITKEGVIKFYVCTLNKILPTNNKKEDFKKDNSKLLTKVDFKKEFALRKDKCSNVEYKFALISIKINNYSEYNTKIGEFLVKYIHNLLKGIFKCNIYIMSNDLYNIILDTNDQRIIDKSVKKALKELDRGTILDEFLINIDSKACVVKYPKDSNKVEDIMKFYDLLLLSDQRYQLFNENIYKKYLKKKMITECVIERINKKDIEILYQPLLTEEKIIGYEVKYNVKGIQPEDIIQEYLDESVLLSFEKSLIEKIISVNAPFEEFLFVGCNTLDYLMKEAYFEKNSINPNIIICIYDYNENIERILKYYHDLGLKIFIDYKVIKKLRIETIIENNVYGVYIFESIIPTERNEILKLMNRMDYIVFANYNFTDYAPCIYRGEEVYKYEDIIDD